MPLLEAMSAGVPILTSNRSALPEVAGDAALLVDPENVDAITQALRDLAQNDRLRKELTVRGRKRSELFTWEQAVAKTWRIYQELL